jgi:membrane fusion protein (multidrug efflux system)
LWKASQDYERYKNLYDDHAITKAQLDEATADKDGAQAALDAAKSQVPVIDKRINTSKEQTVLRRYHRQPQGGCGICALQLTIP